jgi:hypothetical protein
MTIAEYGYSLRVQFCVIFLTKMSVDPEYTVVVSSLPFSLL